MDKERLNIRLQRHLRPLTTANKEKGLKPAKRRPERPVTADVSSTSSSNKIRASRAAKNSLRDSHLKAFERSSDSVEQAEESRGDTVDSAVSFVCRHGRRTSQADDSDAQKRIEDLCLELQEPPDDVDQKPRHPTFESWIAGSEQSSDEFDTDVDDDLETTPMSSIASDATGKMEYEEQCKRLGFVPISYLCRHIGERNIRMRHRYLGGTATKPIALAFKHNTVTEKLDLRDNYIEGSGTCYLANMLKENHFIISLDLSNNFIGSIGAEAIAEMLETNTTLKVLSIAGNQLSDKDAYSFVQALKNNMSVISLDISHNAFSVMGGIYLGGALGINDGLIDLDLSWNCLRKDGAVAIASALRLNKSLEVLDVSWNGFGLEGATALAKSLPVNTTLKVLDLTNNRLDWKAAQALAPGLKKNRCLETCILSMNPLGVTGVEHILKALVSHASIRFLGLEEIGLSRGNVEAIKHLEKSIGMIVVHGGINGHDRTTTVSNVTRLFNQFRAKKGAELRDLFQQYDTDKTGQVQCDDVKLCLRSAGLSLTNRFMDVLLDSMDSTHLGHIDYSSILTGEVFSEHCRRRPSRGFQLLEQTQLEDIESDEENC